MADKAVGLTGMTAVKEWAEETFATPEDVALSHGNITLSTSWSGNGPYTQAVTIPGVTAKSKIDLQPSAAIISQLIEDGVTALLVENNNGVLTAYAVGATPSKALTVQYTRTEVA